MIDYKHPKRTAQPVVLRKGDSINLSTGKVDRA